MPFFSIIIPVFNVNLDYFEVCMNSILKQSFGDFEVIIVDDGSNKDCAYRYDYYAKVDNRVKVIHQANQGVSVARNRGIEAATAEWIMFADADDWLEINACEILNSYLCNISCDILLFSATKEYAEKQEKINYGLEHEKIYKTSEIDIREMLYLRTMGTKSSVLGNLYYSWDKVYNRNFLLDNHLQYPAGISKSEDKVFILRCLQKLSSLLFVDTALYHYRINEASVCNRYSENADSDRIALANLLEQVAFSMDRELGEIKGDSHYNKIQMQFNRFIFGIITDVLFLKYYHLDYPRSKQERNAEVKAFLNTEPFKSSIRTVKYSDLTRKAKVKKFMLSYGLVSQFYKLKQKRELSSGKIAE